MLNTCNSRKRKICSLQKINIQEKKFHPITFVYIISKFTHDIQHKRLGGKNIHLMRRISPLNTDEKTFIKHDQFRTPTTLVLIRGSQRGLYTNSWGL